MPTDNVQKVIKKTNYSITFTTAFAMKFIEKTLTCTATSGDFYEEHVTITSSGIGGSAYGKYVHTVVTAAGTGASEYSVPTWNVAEVGAGATVFALSAGYFEIKAAADSTIAALCYGIWIVDNVKCDTASLVMHSCAIGIRGATGQYGLLQIMMVNSKATYLFGLYGTAARPWANDGTCSGDGGWIKVYCVDGLRYIQLYTGAT